MPRPHAKREQGYTLVEMVTVLGVIGILIGIAAPTYSGIHKSSQKGSATSEVRALVNPIEAYYSDQGTFTGITPTLLKTDYEARITLSEVNVVINAEGDSYFICAKPADSHYWAYKDGPSGPIETSSTSPVSPSDSSLACSLT